jgi:DNA modification methylase
LRLINGDCLDVLPTLPAASIDLTVTSPPYDNLRTYNGSLNDWTPAKWQEIIAELYRVTKPGGVVVWVVADITTDGSETGTSFRQALHAMDCGFRLHDTMIWWKRNAMPQVARNRYTQAHEYMFVFTKGSPGTVNLLREPSKAAGKVRTRKGSVNPESIDRTRTNVTGDTKIRQNVFDVPVGGFAHGHPAVFPETLARDHILSWSNDGDTVLDPFLGSGTTGKMAAQLGRKFIGIERDETYFEVARHRCCGVTDDTQRELAGAVKQ